MAAVYGDREPGWLRWTGRAAGVRSPEGKGVCSRLHLNLPLQGSKAQSRGRGQQSRLAELLGVLDLANHVEVNLLPINYCPPAGPLVTVPSLCGSLPTPCCNTELGPSSLSWASWHELLVSCIPVECEPKRVRAESDNPPLGLDSQRPPGSLTAFQYPPWFEGSQKPGAQGLISPCSPRWRVAGLAHTTCRCLILSVET